MRTSVEHRPSSSSIFRDIRTDRELLETTAIKGISAYQAGLTTLGVTDEWIARADELLQGDHTSGDRILLGGSNAFHAKAVEIGKEVLTGAIRAELRKKVDLSNEEVMAVGELFMLARRNEPEVQSAERVLAKERRSEEAWKLIKPNKTLRRYVKLHPDCFYLPR